MFELLLFIGLPTAIAVLLAVVIYRFTARRFQTHLARLWQGTSRHPIVTLVLILYGMIGGYMLGLMFLTPSQVIARAIWQAN